MEFVYLIQVEGGDQSTSQFDWTYGIYSTREKARSALNEIVESSKKSPELLEYTDSDTAYAEGPWYWTEYSIQKVKIDAKIQ